MKYKTIQLRDTNKFTIKSQYSNQDPKKGKKKRLAQ